MILKRILTPLWVLTLSMTALPLLSAEIEDEPPEWSFVTGRYQLIGRHPDSVRTYTGTAQLERSGKRLLLSREIGGKKTRMYGVIRRADPGEANVLAFAWGVQPTMEMVCLIGSDLDNYARLTCHWGKRGNPHTQPGLEAYFAQEHRDPVTP